ncbi:MAG: DNA primase, partial [Myxococcota bacterium]
MSTLPPWPPQLRSLEAEERAARALHRAWRDVSHAGEGERNDRLNRAAFSAAAYVREGLIALEEVRQALTHAADRCGLPAREAAATIES